MTRGRYFMKVMICKTCKVWQWCPKCTPSVKTLTSLFFVLLVGLDFGETLMWSNFICCCNSSVLVVLFRRKTFKGPHFAFFFFLSTHEWKFAPNLNWNAHTPRELLKIFTFATKIIATNTVNNKHVNTISTDFPLLLLSYKKGCCKYKL